MNMRNRDTANHHEQLRWAHCLTRDALVIETSDGHRLSCDEGVWYAYPLTDEPRLNVDKSWMTTGNPVIMFLSSIAFDYTGMGMATILHHIQTTDFNHKQASRLSQQDSCFS